MKNFYYMGIAGLLFFFVLSCSKDENSALFLKRDTDQLSFAYEESNETFTVRANGSWSIDLSEADWVSVDPIEGVGDGETVQIVNVTASRNVGDMRNGIIKIVSGEKEALINISQEEGKVIFGTPYFTAGLVSNFPLEDTYLVIPYNKGGLEEGVSVSTQISGIGSAGIQVSNTDVDMSSENGEVRLPITGTPTTDGQVTFNIQILGQTLIVNTAVREQGNNDPIGTVYLSQDFDLLVLGGDHVGNAQGLHLVGTWPTEAGLRVLPPNPAYAVSGTRNTDGTGDYFATMHPTFVASRGLEGWTGLRVYERPGYIKIGTAASPDGYLATPPLTAIAGWADVKVKFTAARWSESGSLDPNATVTVRVLNAGTSDDANREISLTPGWTDKEIIVEGATAETVIEFRARNAGNGRFLLDNIEISKVIK
ncbi:BACON domain-containing protein [Sphingobacterium phlebotomi]|uniref:BACON domain-containing protein n=1 Tax=Sphingobacterium phlebotomi TaxID=2605433 RepID=A0A5D4H0X2_9SPHI|nr:BACON domain-containing protein [Sphingobacterium phlebotomi]TYR34197.1 BACON domain-containing protein [Sphingobacterium phlebotomi]